MKRTKLSKTLKHAIYIVCGAGLLWSTQTLAAGVAPNALPTGANVQAGQANIIQSQNTLNVNQTSQKAVVGWSSFNVGERSTVNFNQPNANASTLNIVNGSSKSMIEGAVNAKGQVIFENQNGVVFGKGAEINVGAMVATTMAVDPNAYMSASNTQTYSGNGSGKVVNKGKITVTDPKGYVALMAPEVVNEGVISARISGNNSIALVSGQQVTISFADRQLVSVSVDASTVKSLIQNKRLIQTEGGQILIAANSAQDLRNSVIQNTGTISANSISKVGGKIHLFAGAVNQTGTLAANSETSTGGQITMTGNQVTLANGSQTTATGATGGGQVLIGTNSVNPISTTNAGQLAQTVVVQANAVVDTSATQNGNGGNISIWSSQSTSVAGVLKSSGGQRSGNGGSIETSSKGVVSVGVTLAVDTTAAHGKTGQWITDPISITVDSAYANVLSNALSTTNVILDATLPGCSGVSGCSLSATPLITFLQGADVFSANPNTSLTLNALGGKIFMNSNVNAGQVYAVAEEINVNGSIYSTGGAGGQIYLAGAALNILGSLGSNGNTSGSNQGNQSNSNNGGSNSSGSGGTAGGSTSGTRRKNGVNGALISDNNTYSTNGGTINLVSTGDINIGSSTNTSAYISANGVSGGTINVVSLGGNLNNYGVIDAVGLINSGGKITTAATQTNTFVGAMMAVDGLNLGGTFQIGIANGVGTGSTLAPPIINAQLATLLAAINFSPSVNSTLLSSVTNLDSATIITANAQVTNSVQNPSYSTPSNAGSIYIAGNNSLSTAATITANADNGGLILLSSPAGIYQNTGYIQTNGGAGLGGTIAQSGLISTTLTGATLQANGQIGGGNIITGRDFQANPLSGSATQDALLPLLSSVVNIPTSALTVIDSTSSLSSNSLGSGNAGNLLTWGNNLAALGTLSSQALGSTGNGGLIETSGNQLVVSGIVVKASSIFGAAGTWVLDPYDVTIAASGATGTNYAASFTAGATSTVLASSIVGSLNAGTNVSISTGSAAANTIFVTAPISATTAGGGSLTFTGGVINLQANVTTVGSQTYNGAVIINNSTGVQLTTTNSSVTFSSTIDSFLGSNNSLTIANGTGITYLNGVVGATTPLGSLIVSGTGGSYIYNNITTIGTQNYAGSLTVYNTISLNSGSGDVRVAGSVSAGQVTSVLALFGSGSFQFNGTSYTANNGDYWFNGTKYSASSTPITLGGAIALSFNGTQFTVTSPGNTTLSYLLVGGGGSAGSGGGGGGGGGGVLQNSSFTLSGGINYYITVGAGGVGGNGAYPNGVTGSAGASTLFTNYSNVSLTAYGGGSGSGESQSATPGACSPCGSGGGLSYLYGNYWSALPQSGIAGQGNSGGAYLYSSTNLYSGGGGGAGGAASYQNGGAGVTSTISGVSATYGQGGNGGSLCLQGTCSSGGNGNGYLIGMGASGYWTYSGDTRSQGGNGAPGAAIFNIQTYSANLTLNTGSGRAVISGGVSNVALSINSKSGTSSIGGVISGTNAVNFNTATTPTNYTANNSSSAILNLSGNNTYSGGTTVSGGTLQAGSATAFGVSSSSITLSSGAALDLNGQTLTNTNSLILNGTGINNSGALTNSSTNAGTFAGAITLGTAPSIGSSSGGITVSGSIGGTTGVTINGGSNEAAIVKLSGTNNYTGGTTLTAGTLQAGSATAFGASTSSVTVSNGSALDLNGQILTNTNALTLNGTGINSAGVLSNSSANPGTYAGAITLGGNSLIATAGGNVTVTGGITGTGSLTLSSNSATGSITLSTNTVNNTGAISNIGPSTGTVTISASVGSAVTAITQNSSTSALVLSGNSTYSGGTTITTGTLRAGSASALGTGAVSIGATATLDLTFQGTVSIGSTLSMVSGSAITNSVNTSNFYVTGASTLFGNLNTTGTQTYNGSVNLGAATTINTANANVTFNSTIDGAYGLTLNQGTGQVNFNNIVGGGTVLVNLNVVGTGATYLGGSNTGITTSGSMSFGGNLYLGAANTSLTTTGNSTITIAGNTNSNLPNINQTFLNPGTFTFTPTTSISNVTLLVVGGGGGGGGTGASGGGGGGGGGGVFSTTVSLTGGSTYSVVVGAGGSSGANGGTSQFGSYTVGGGGAGAYSSTPNSYAGNSGVAGTAATGYSGGSSATNGIGAGGTGTGGVGTLTTGSNGGAGGAGVSYTLGGVVYLVSAGGGGGSLPGGGGAGGVVGSTTIGGAGVSGGVGGSASNLGYGSGGGGAENNPNGGNGSAGLVVLVKSGSSSGANLTINSGTGRLSMGGASNLGTLAINSSNAANSVSGSINGVTSITYNGTTTGVLSLSGANTYSGNTSITAGTLKAGSATAFGASSSSINVSSGSVLDLNGQTLINTNSLTLNGTGINGLGALTNTSANAGTYVGAITLGTAPSIGGSSGSITSSGAIGGTTGLTINGGPGESAIIKLSGANSYTGGTTLVAGTLQAGSTTAFGASSSAVTVNVGAALDLNGQNLINTNSLILSGTGINSGGSLINSSTTAGTYAGPVTLATNTSLGGIGAIIFGSTIDSAPISPNSLGFSLSNATGANNPVTFNGLVGGNYPLQSLTTGTGITTLGSYVTTTGNQSYGGNVIVSGTSVDLVTTGASSSGGSISFASNVDGSTAGANSLFLSTGAGTVNVTGNIGATTALGYLALGGTGVYNSGVLTYSNYGTYTYTVPAGITLLTINAVGAQGGTSSSTTGGYGASITGNFAVTPGQSLTIVVGQQGPTNGASPNSSGGGGSGVLSSGTLLLVAGGGGGGGGGTGANALATSTGSGGNGSSFTYSSNGSNIAYGGNGYLAGLNGSTGTAGSSANTLTTGGSFGLGGGGGSVGASYCNCGGGGGGYTGGNSGGTNTQGAGGSSYNSGTFQINVAGGSAGATYTGGGFVTLTTPAVSTFTAGAQTGSITIGGSINLNTLKTGNSAFNLTLGLKNNASSIATATTFNNTGSLTLGSSVGSPQTLTLSGALTISSPNAVSIGANINSTTAAQTYGSAVAIINTATLSTTNATVSFLSTVDSSAGSSNALTVSSGSGTVAFGAAVGSQTPLSTLIVTGMNGNSTGQITTLGANISTAGAQSYGGNVVLGVSAITLNSSSGNVSIAGNVSTTAIPGVLEFLYSNQYIYAGTTYSIGQGPLASQITGSNGVYTFTSTTVGAVNSLVVGGGGAGGSIGGGGGGGGGVLTPTLILAQGVTYSILVGRGGTPFTNGSQCGASPYCDGGSGSSSSIIGYSQTITALGGGGGGGANAVGLQGGSGGGNGQNTNSSSAGAGTAGQGYGGGTTPTSSPYPGGGGGGASAVGANGSGANSGGGGAGVSNSITGTSVVYGSGGGGSSWSASTGGVGGTNAGNGGSHGVAATSGLANTGGGGGGGYGSDLLYGAAGGSGIVVFGGLGNIAASLTINSGAGKTTLSGNVSYLTTLAINSTAGASSVGGSIVGATTLSLNTSNGYTGVTSTGAVFALSGNNTFTGGVTIGGGTLQAVSSTAFGAASSTITVSSGAALDLNGQNLTNVNPLILNGSGINSAGALINRSISSAAYAGPITLAANTTFGGAGSITFGSTVNSASISPNSLGYSLSNAAGFNYSLTFNGVVGGIYPLSNLTTGSGSTTIFGNITTTGAQNYGGSMTVFGSATLNSSSGGVTIAGSISQGGLLSAVQLLGNGSYSYNGSTYTLNTPVVLGGTISLSWNGTNYTVVDSINQTVSYLMVGGGGGGGGGANSISGGGGGAGGVLNGTTSLSSGTNYLIVVGSGGVGDTSAYYGTNGGDTTFTGLTTAKGGGGGSSGGGNYSATSGGSGGGANSSGNHPSGSGTAGQGYSGGTIVNYYGSIYAAAGGGAGGAPSNSVSGGVSVGGAPVVSNITGTNVNYGQGGDARSGGYFGPADSAGAANTGNGGGGGGIGYPGLSGGSGVVVIAPSSSSASSSLTINAGNSRANIGGGVSNVNLTINSTLGSSSIVGLISGAAAIHFNTGTTPVNYTGVNSSGAILNLSGNNTYTGGTTVSGGTLQAGSATAFGASSSSITVNSGAVLDLNGQTLSNTNALTLNGTGISSSGVVINSSSTGAGYTGLITLGSNSSIIAGSGSITLSNTGIITGPSFGLTLGGAQGGSIASIIGTTTGALTKQDAGTWTLTGSNTYTGGTTVNGGVLSIASGGTSGTNLSTGNLTLAGGALLDTATSTIGNAISLGAGVNTLAAATTKTATFSNAVNGVANNISIGFGTNNGVVVFGGTNTYSGSTYVNVGTLQLGNASALGTSSVSVSSGAVLDLNGKTPASANSLNLSGTGINSGGALINTSATQSTYSGLITLGSATSISGGTGPINITNTGVITGAFGLTLDGAQGGSIVSIIGTSTGTVTKQGAGTWTISGANTYSGNTSLSAGTLVVANSAALGSGNLVMASGTTLQAGATSVSLSNPVAMNGAATINAPSGDTLTFSGVISGTGTPTINSGNTGTVLFTNSSNTFGSATNATNITVSGGVLGIVADGSLGVTPSSTKAASITLSGGVLEAYGVPTELSSNSVTLGPNRGVTLTAASGLAATTTNSGANVDSLQVQGVVTGAYALTINAGAQAGLVKLSGSNTYSGGTTITSGTLVDTNATGLGSASAPLTISNAAKLDLQNTLTVASLSMSSSAQIINTGGNSALTVSGVSTLGSVVTTTGTQTYNGNITLGSATTLTAGLFSFSNSTTSGAYALSLVPYGSSFTGAQSLAGLTLGSTTMSFTVGAAGNTAAITLPTNITVAGPIAIYGGAINVSGSLSDTYASANSGIQLFASGAFTLASGKTITTTNANVVVTGAQIVINNSSANAISAGGANNYWNIWSSNSSPFNSTASLADNDGALVYNYKQYNISYGSAVSGSGNGLLFSYAPSLSFGLTGSVSKAYDGTTTATLVSGNYSVIGAVGGDVITYTQPTSGVYAASNAGTGIGLTAFGISFTSAVSSTSKTVYGYQVASTTAIGNVGVITAKQLTATLVANNKVYDATNTATGTLSLTGFLGADNGTVTPNSVTFASSNVAYSGSTVVSQTVTATGLTLGSSLSNYSLASTTVTSTATITPAPLTITATNQAGFVTRAPSLSNAAFVASGLIGSQSIASVSLSTNATSASAANNYPISISAAVASAGTTLGNYSITYSPGIYTVVPAGGLLISTNGVSTTYGTNGLVSPVSISYLSGGGSTITTITSRTTSTSAGVTLYSFVDGASGSLSFSLAPTATSTSGSGNLNVGSYALVASNFTTTSANLAANAPLVVTGNYSVTPKSVAVTATAATVVYSASSQIQGYSSGVFNGDLVTINGLASGTNVGTYSSSLSASGIDKGNYTFSYTNANLNISPATLTVTGSTSSGTYNASLQINGVASITGFLGADSGTVSGYAQGTNAGTYRDNLTVSAASGTQLSNYALVISNGTLNIGKSTLVVMGATTTNTYNGLTQTNVSATVSGAQGNDAFTVTGLVAAKNVGTYTDNLSVAAIGSTLLSNYNISRVNGSLTITKANLTVTGANNTVTYSASTQTNSGATILGAQGTDSFTVIGYGAGKNVGTYADNLSLSGVGSTLTSNYNITFVNAALTINPALMSITGSTSNLTYTGAALTNNFSVLGLLSPDTVTGVAGLASRTNVGTSNDQLSSATGTGLSNYTITYVNGSLTVNPAALTITGATSTHVYTGASQVNTFSTSGLLGASDSVSSVSGLASAIQVGTVVDQLSGAVGTGLSNYNITYVNGSLTITKAPLTITGGTTSVVYTAGVQTNTFTFSGLLRSDSVTGVNGLASGTNVGTSSDSLSGATGTGLSNYNITYANGSLTITKAALTITGATTSLTYTAQAYTNSYSVSGLLGSDSVTGVSGQATRTNAGTTADSLSAATGTGLGNYTITYTNHGLTITQAPLTITGTTTTNVYTAASQTNTYSVSGLLGSDTVTGVTGLASATNVGTTADNLSALTGQGITNYSVHYVNGSLTITPAPLTIAANNTASFVTKPTAQLTFTTAGLLGADTVSSASLATVATSSSAAGDYPITISAAQGAHLGNYTITYQPATYTVVPAGQLLVTTNGANSTYGTPTSATPVTVSYLSPQDNTTIGTLNQTSSVTTNGVTTYVYDDGAGTTATFSIAPSSPNHSGSGNLSVGVYGLTTGSFTKTGTNLISNTATITGNSSVNPLSATVTGVTTIKAYNANAQTAANNIATSGYTSSGLVYGDNLVISGVASGTNTGTYQSTLSVSGADSGNYTFSITNHALTITPISLTISGGSTSSVYNGTTQSNNASLSVVGLVGNDAVTSVSGLATGKSVGTYTDSLNTALGTGLGNYSIGYVNGGLSITPATLSATLTASNKVYDSTTSATGSIGLAGVFSGDTVTGTAGNVSFVDPLVGSAKVVTANNITISGSSANNYVLSNTTASSTANITAAPLSITGATSSAIYNGTTQSNANSFTVSGLFGSDQVTSVSGQSSGKNVGVYTDALTNAQGSGLSNYAIAYHQGALTINQAPLLVLGATTTTTYNATQQTNSYSVIGLQGTDSVSVSGSAYGVNAGTYNDTLAVTANSGTLLSNYSLTTTNSTLTINPAVLTPVLFANGKMYDTTTTATGTIGLRGVYATDVVSGTPSSVAFIDPNAGANKVVSATGISLSGAAASNYVLSSTTASSNATIAQAPLTIAANNQAGFVTQPTNNLSYTVTGLLGLDAVSSATMQTVASSTTSAGTYPINISGAQGAGVSNYSITYVPAVYTVVPAGQLLINTNGSTTTYGATLTSPTQLAVSYLDPNSLIINNLTLSSSSQSSDGVRTYIYSDGASGTATFTFAALNPYTSGSGHLSVGSYGIGVDTFSKTTANLTSNTATVLGSFAVTPLAATITASSSGLVYSASLQTGGYSSAQRIARDNVTVAGLASGTTVGSYTSNLSTSGIDVGNYVFTYVNQSMPITPAALTITGANSTSTYNSTQQTNSGFTTTGLLGSDAVISVSGHASGRSVGVYSDTLNNAVGSGLNNYNIAYVNGSLTIQTSNPTLTNMGLSSSTVTFGASAPVLTPPVTTGDGPITYSSSNPSVLTVNPSTGVITLVGPGNAVITATLPTTSNQNGTTESIPITVLASSSAAANGASALMSAGSNSVSSNSSSSSSSSSGSASSSTTNSTTDQGASSSNSSANSSTSSSTTNATVSETSGSSSIVATSSSTNLDSNGVSSSGSTNSLSSGASNAGTGASASTSSVADSGGALTSGSTAGSSVSSPSSSSSGSTSNTSSAGGNNASTANADPSTSAVSSSGSTTNPSGPSNEAVGSSGPNLSSSNTSAEAGGPVSSNFVGGGAPTASSTGGIASSGSGVGVSAASMETSDISGASTSNLVTGSGSANSTPGSGSLNISGSASSVAPANSGSSGRGAALSETPSNNYSAGTLTTSQGIKIITTSQIQKNDYTETIIKVEVPPAIAQSRFEFAVPDNVIKSLEIGQNSVIPVASLLNKPGLPGWLTFDSKTLTFSAKEIPENALPVTVEIQTGNKKIILEITDLI